jgi:hypothetical protein
MSALPEPEFDATAAFEKVMARAHDDPQFFFEHVLNVKPRRWQRELHDEIKRRIKRGERHLQIHVRAAHGAGKGFESAGLVLWWQSTRPGARCLTTAPNWRDVEQLLWAEIRTLYAGSLLKIAGIGRMLNTMWDCDNGWFATGASSDKPENLEGQHSLVAACRVVDEAKAVPDPVFVSTEGLLSSMETLDVWISTPSERVGKFYERDRDGGPELIRKVVTIDDLVADNVPGALRWKQYALREYGGESSFEYRSRAMAEYIDNAEGGLFPYSWIERAMMSDEERVRRGLSVFHILHAPTLGYDVAGSADGDENVVAPVSGPDAQGRFEVGPLRGWHERDTEVSKAKVLEIARASHARCVRIDMQGLGHGVVFSTIAEIEARNLPLLVDEYRSADQSEEPERFLNRKAENAWAMRYCMERDGLRLPNEPKLREQLAAMRYEIKQGKIRIVDPKDSPDHFDAVLIGLGNAYAPLSMRDVGFGKSDAPYAVTASGWGNAPSL